MHHNLDQVRQLQAAMSLSQELISARVRSEAAEVSYVDPPRGHAATSPPLSLYGAGATLTAQVLPASVTFGEARLS